MIFLNKIGPNMNIAVTEKIEIITFSSLYPNSAQPNHGVFLQNRLGYLMATGQVRGRVVAPVPWFPFSGSIFGRYSVYAKVGAEEVRAGIHVDYPKFTLLPKIGMTLTPGAIFRSALPVLKRLQQERDFDLIDAHYFYPDGVAAVRLGQVLNKPVVVTAHGTDLNLIPEYPRPRRMIQEAARGADGIIAVSQALKDAIVALGVPDGKVTVLRNGVDLKLFHPDAREASRKEFKLNGPTLLSVGLLIPRKGHELVIGALPALPEYTLLIIGQGPERANLERLAVRLKVDHRVRFLGGVPHHELHKYYSAADAFVLASSREGLPCVLPESIACGTPVVASNIWGNPEVVCRPEAGVLMKERTSEAVAEAVQRLFRQLPDRRATRRYGEEFGWDSTAQGQLRLIQDVLRKR